MIGLYKNIGAVFRLKPSLDPISLSLIGILKNEPLVMGRNMGICCSENAQDSFSYVSRQKVVNTKSNWIRCRTKNLKDRFRSHVPRFMHLGMLGCPTTLKSQAKTIGFICI